MALRCIRGRTDSPCSLRASPLLVAIVLPVRAVALNTLFLHCGSESVMQLCWFRKSTRAMCWPFWDGARGCCCGRNLVWVGSCIRNAAPSTLRTPIMTVASHLYSAYPGILQGCLVSNRSVRRGQHVPALSGDIRKRLTCSGLDHCHPSCFHARQVALDHCLRQGALLSPCQSNGEATGRDCLIVGEAASVAATAAH